MTARRYQINVSAKVIHYYPAWEECNIDDAGDDIVVVESVTEHADMLRDFEMCKICETKER